MPLSAALRSRPLSIVNQRSRNVHSVRDVRVKTTMQTPFVPAIVTPFDKVGGLERGSLKRYLKFLWEAGFQDIVVNGSTGEFCSMTLSERKEVAEVARESWPGRQFINVSSCSVQDSLDLLQHCQQTKEHLKGDRCIADGVLLLPPYYFADSDQAGLESFFVSVIQEASIPVYLYNFPANAGSMISVELYQKLTQRFSQLKGIKNTFDDIPLQKKFKAAAPDRQIYVGHDPSVLAALEAGLDGAIAATASVLPEHLLGIAASFASGDNRRAQQHLGELDKWNTEQEKLGVNIFAAVKAGLSHRLPSFPTAVRPPLVESTAVQTEGLVAVLKGLGV